ncbi:MAG TPA: caspase family protein, partial [Acidobacteriota bacterium]|nr:caspase family protein [Acidobacteriota bacterium]
MQRWVVILVLAMICAVPNYIGVQGFVVPQDRGQRVSGSTGARNTTRKLALVIGNSAYTEAPLKNPANDASDMAVALKQLGFEVMSAINVNQREMKRLIREFGGQLRTGGVGVFFYAGHGMQVNGRNYLIPIGATINTEPDVEDEAVDVNLLLGQFEMAGNGLNIVILDACRNNPFGRSFRSVEKGLAQMTAPTGTVVIYATAPGRVASDGNTRNGLYTQELLTNLRQPGMRLEDILIQTRVAVKTKSGGQQVPWENGALEGVFYFVPPGANSGGGSSGSSVTAETVEEDAWNEIKDSPRAEDFKVFLREFPNGKRAPLARVKLAKVESPSVPIKPVLTAGSRAQYGGMEFV